jgi:hydrogenase-4 membrane subunit HyfE
MLEYLQGKKSYIVGALMIALGVLQNDQNLILQGISVMTLRAAIGKV